MSKTFKGFVRKTVASLTMTTSVLGIAGFSALAPTTALAVVPADYGLREGDTISAAGSNDPDIYIVNDWGYKRLFLNPVIFTFYGHLGWQNVKTVAPQTRDAFTTSGLYRNCETGDQRVWGVEITGEDTGILHWVNTTGAQAVIDDPQFFLKVFCINNNEFNWYPKGSDYTSVNQVPDYSRGGTGSPTPTPSGAPLQGGAGSLQNADFIASLNNEEVGEGENNIAVTGLDLEADNGSDLRVTSVRVSFQQHGVTVSDDLDDYADEVTLWFNGSEVGSIDVSDLDEDAGVWSSAITLTGNAIIRMGQTEDLRVALSALDVIDSTDLGATQDWEVTIENVRYVDAQGAVTTEASLDNIGSPTAGSGGTDDRDFTFESFAAAADLELNLNEATDNPDARVVAVDDASTTDDVVLLTGNLEAEGGDILVEEMVVTIATTGASLGAIVDSINLEVDGDIVQTLSPSNCTHTTVASCSFDDVDVEISEGDSAKVRVLVDVNGTDDIGVQGATLTATIDNGDTSAEDQNGDALLASDKTGTANGEAQSFFSEGIQATFEGADETVTPNDAGADNGLFVIHFDVSAFDTVAYVDRSCADDATPPTPPAVNGQGVIFNVTGGAAVTCVVDSAADTASGTFEVLEGSTESFTLTVNVVGANDFVTVAMESINWASFSTSAANQFYTFDLENYKTDPVFVAI